MPSRTLDELMSNASVELVHGSSSARIEAIVEDSRQMIPGALFIARQGGAVDGRQFIDEAIRKGAVAILSDRKARVSPDIAFVVADDVAQAAAELAERFYDNPSRHLRLIGITGTNGKTTTAHLVHQLLSAGDVKCGLIGTVQIDDGTSMRAATLTTPSAIEISALLRSMVDAGCRACVMEVSSHALHQKRVAGLAFDVGVFTNLSGDHLDYHGSMEAYASAKAILLQSLTEDGFAVVNVDDAHCGEVTHGCRAKQLRCSASDAQMEWFADVREESMRGVDVVIRGPWKQEGVEAHLPLIGRHNVMNAMEAAAACHALSMKESDILDALAKCTAPPGRLEPVAPPDAPFAVFVDYAHTDDALDNVLRAVKPLVQSGGQLRVVFGCGGDRDRTKRPRMAHAAWKWADEVIVTSDNPRTEAPDAIIREVLDGVPVEHIPNTLSITDRREAIRFAVESAQPNDIVLIAGKGHEDYQIIGTSKRPFDDRVIAREVIASRIPMLAAKAGAA